MILPVTFDRPQCPSIAKLLGKTSMDEAWDHALMIGSNNASAEVQPPRPQQASAVLGMNTFLSYEAWVPDRIKFSIRSLDEVPIVDAPGGERDLVDRITFKLDIDAAFLPLPRISTSQATQGRIEQGGAAPWQWIATGTQERISEYYGTHEGTEATLSMPPMAMPALSVLNKLVRWNGARWVIPSFPPGPFSQSYDVKLSLTPPIRLR